MNLFDRIANFWRGFTKNGRYVKLDGDERLIEKCHYNAQHKKIGKFFKNNKKTGIVERCCYTYDGTETKHGQFWTYNMKTRTREEGTYSNGHKIGHFKKITQTSQNTFTVEEGEYAQDGSEKKVGHFIRYNKLSGYREILEECTFDDQGRRHGAYYFYDPITKEKQEYTYDHGRRVGKFKITNKEGITEEGFYNTDGSERYCGPYMKYNIYGDLLEQCTFAKDGNHYIGAFYSYNPQTGIREEGRCDDAGGGMVVEYSAYKDGKRYGSIYAIREEEENRQNASSSGITISQNQTLSQNVVKDLKKTR